MTRRAALCTMAAGLAGAFFAQEKGPKQKWVHLMARETKKSVRVWIDGEEITDICTEFSSKDGWAICYTDKKKGFKQTRRGRIFYLIDGDPCYV